MKLNSKLLFGVVVFFGIVNLLDVITAMFILPGESNPIYLLTQSYIILWVIKILFVSLILYVYFKNEYPSRFWLYSYIYILIIGSIMIAFGIYSNVLGILNPQIVETAATLSKGQKASYYGQVVGLFMIIPYIISMISFKVYDIVEHKIKYKKQ